MEIRVLLKIKKENKLLPFVSLNILFLAKCPGLLGHLAFPVKKIAKVCFIFLALIIP